MPIMNIIFKSTLKNIKIFTLTQELRIKIFGIWIKLNFAQAVTRYIRS